jgi:hypothetical protein
MNEYTLVRKIQRLVKDWYFDDWRKFRRTYNYWEVKDKLYKEKKYFQFKQFKYVCLRDYLNLD